MSGHRGYEGQGRFPDVRIAPLYPPDSETLPGASARLASWMKATGTSQNAPEQNVALGLPDNETVQSRLAYQLTIFYHQLENFLEGTPITHTLSREHAMRQHNQVRRLLVHATPSERLDILILANNDWRAYLEIHGEHLSAKDLVTGFMMQAADIRAGIEEGRLTYPDILPIYANYAIEEARERFDHERIDPDTEEQAHDRLLATELQLEPLLAGTAEGAIIFCKEMAADAVNNATSRTANTAALAYANWNRMALRVYEASIA